ncbi:TPA: hypothetical protein ACX6QO_001020 [Photobacterium damselae]
MTISNNEKSKINIRKVKEFIDSGKSPPLYRGRLNKTKFLESLGIKENARQNVEIAEMLHELDITIAKKPRKKYEDPSNETVKRLREVIEQLERKLAIKEAQIDDLLRNDVRESLLVKQGRLLPSVAVLNDGNDEN